mgnify:CR=1 FL=1
MPTAAAAFPTIRYTSPAHSSLALATVPPIPLPTVLHTPGRRPSARGDAPPAPAPWMPGAGECAVAVGNFDGVHRGHAAIVARLCGLAKTLGVPAVALTFDPHPASVVRPEASPAALTTPERRAALLMDLGVDAVLVQPATRDLMALSAERFYADILRDRLRVRGLVEGEDFRFGAGRGGDIGMLRGFCDRDGISLETVAAVMVGGQPVSSSRLRGLIVRGDVRGAAALLTAPYRLTGTVVEGARRGGPLGFPTANLANVATLLPAAGVYAARAVVPGLGIHPAAVHVGVNVTFGETRPTVEAHLIGFTGTLYGTSLDVDFLERLRDTQKFDSIDSLRAQLTADVAGALQIVRSAFPTT